MCTMIGCTKVVCHADWVSDEIIMDLRQGPHLVNLFEPS